MLWGYKILCKTRIWRGYKILWNKKKKSCFLQKCNGSHLSSQWYPPSCPLSVQPTSSKRRAYQMGFSLNSLEAEQLKHALQRDSSVSEITLNQNQAFNVTNCSHIPEYSKWEAASNSKCVTLCHFLNQFFLFVLVICIGKTMQFFSSAWFDRISSASSGSAPGMRTEGGREDGWKDARQRTGGDGGRGQIPPPCPGMCCVCGSQAKEMVQPRREGSSTWVTLTSPAGGGFCGVQIAHF